MRKKIRPILFWLTVVLPGAGVAQQWTSIETSVIPTTGFRDIRPERFVTFAVASRDLREQLWSAPDEENQDVRTSPVEIAVPLADGTIDRFHIVRYAMMEPGLADTYPGIRTFRGRSVTDPHRRLRADWTKNGFRAVITDLTGRTYIDPYQRGDSTHLIVYRKQDLSRTEAWTCDFDESRAKDEEPVSRVFGDCQFRTFRLALATTGEYSNFFGATSAAQSGLVMAQVVTAVNRVNEVYEIDFATRLLLISNTANIFYYNPATDPYTNSNGSTMLGENQTTCDNVIGSANYDIGHVFSTGGGGVAYLNAICNNSLKAGGVTGSANPVGDPFYIDYVAHEMGHQFGGNHTQNQTCNRVASTAYEPGSASTIMGYAGICPPNVQNNSDDYFHAISLLEITNRLLAVNCHQTLTFNNTPPDAGNTPNYTIPVSTPFVLTGNGSDPNGDPITYCWEQYDLEATSTEPPAANDPDGPLFRSFDLTTSPSRYFPRLTDLVNNVSPQFEVLPSVARTLNFRLTVRDDHGLGGCSDHDDVALTVTASAGPFQVTSQNTATTWTHAQNVTVTWNVANTTSSPVNCTLVDIYLSYDGGLTYPVTLLEDHPNDGSASFNVPAGATTSTGRVMIRASGNIFFDINNANITINTGTPNYTLALNPATLTECNDGSVQTTVVVGSYQGFSNPVTLSASNLPPGGVASFSPSVVTPGNTSTLTISNLNGLSGSFNIVVQGSASSGVQQRDFYITLLGGPTGTATLNSPANNATGVYINPLLAWSAVSGATGYDYQIALDNQFSQIVQSGNVNNTQFQVTTALTSDVQHFWRIRPINTCGSGTWSSGFSFTTGSCFLLYSPDVPKIISASGTPTVFSTLVSPFQLTITDLDILDLEGTHTWIDDLKFSLISPQGTERLFWDRPCDNHDNFDINFDDEAATQTHPCPPTNGLSYNPTNPISIFDGQPSAGTWTMKVQDLFDQDGGSLNKWGLKVCGTPPCQLVVNQTGATGPGSLRAAIDCAEPGDTVLLAASLAGQTINIGSSPQALAKNLTILAQAANISITGSGTRVFEVSSGVTVLLEGMMLTAGVSADGSALINNGNLILKGLTINPNPGVQDAVLIRNAASAQLMISSDCLLNQ